LSLTHDVAALHRHAAKAPIVGEIDRPHARGKAAAHDDADDDPRPDVVAQLALVDVAEEPEVVLLALLAQFARSTSTSVVVLMTIVSMLSTLFVVDGSGGGGLLRYVNVSVCSRQRRLRKTVSHNECVGITAAAAAAAALRRR